MRKAKTKRTTGSKHEFFFLGNHLALDFLNTNPVLSGKPVELLPDFAALLQWFHAAGLLTAHEVRILQQRWGESARARHSVEAMRRLRERLRKKVFAWESGEAIHPTMIAELNRLMRRHPMRTKLKPGKGEPATELWFEPHQPEDLFAPLALSAATLFAHVDRNRVRNCANCVGHFYDTSKKGTRRWCSMQLCGNRMKVAAYAARARRNANS